MIATASIPPLPSPTRGETASAGAEPTRLALMPSPLPRLAPTDPVPSPTPGSTVTAQPALTPTVLVEDQAFEVGKGKARFKILGRASRMRLELALDEGGKQVMVAGETSALYGQLVLDYDNPSASQFDLFAVELRALAADLPDQEPGFWERWLAPAYQPTATFQATEVRALFPLVTGRPSQFQLVGEMRVGGIVRVITWDGTVTFEAGRARGMATTSIPLADLGLPPAGATGTLSAATSAMVTVDFVLEEFEPTPEPYVL